jgi:ATP-dependent Clp protease protease subunit
MTEGNKAHSRGPVNRPFVATIDMRPVPVRGPLNQATATSCVNRLLSLEKQDRIRPILLHITSPLGSLAECLSIMRILDSLSCPAITFCASLVGGPAVLLAAHGLRGCRVATPDCRFSLSPSQFVAETEHSEREDVLVQDQLVRILARDLRRTEAQAREWLQSASELSAEEALKCGLIDSIANQPLFPEG